ncbi:hypothetical protein CALVIDRAFT_248314 [Calocera viscosa TUFC12733]|uniref:CENP-V/GFA domain-containing protein n=1 Tax=Calocera viscosa (strain TUFC12733) TaxID=1330018 RepID=A0A167JC39_CALVF|nr:hypothetical protein CALVIDRAFT_248314 [Calocera viscosa TUFC12733]
MTSPFPTALLPEWTTQPPYSPTPGVPFEPTWHGSCHCQGVHFLVRGQPLDVKFCHCTDCQTLQAAPFQWAAIFHKEDVLVTEGVGELEFYASSSHKQEHELPCKVYCRACHTALFDEGRRMLMLFPTLLDLPRPIPGGWKARCHIFYGSRVVDINDGTPKWKGHKDESERIPEGMLGCAGKDLMS